MGVTYIFLALFLEPFLAERRVERLRMVRLATLGLAAQAFWALARANWWPRGDDAFLCIFLAVLLTQVLWETLREATRAICDLFFVLQILFVITVSEKIISK